MSGLALVQIGGQPFDRDFRRYLLRAAAAAGDLAIHIECADRPVLAEVAPDRATSRSFATPAELWDALAPRLAGRTPIVLTGLAAGWSPIATAMTRRFPRRSRIYDVQDDLRYGARGLAYAKFIARDRFWRSLCARTIVLEAGMRRFYRHADHLDNASHLTPATIDLGGPAVYLGSIDSRVDFALLEELGKARRIDIYGKVHGWTPWLADAIDDLQKRQTNIRFLGEYRNEDLAGFIGKYRIGLVPYHVGHAMTEHVNPDKIYHYLNAGLGVVSTAIPQARRMAAHIGLVHDAADYDRARGDALERRRGWSVPDHGWPRRWQELAGMMTRPGNAPPI